MWIAHEGDSRPSLNCAVYRDGVTCKGTMGVAARELRLLSASPIITMW